MYGQNRTQRTRERGQSVVEMALCFPIFILVVMALLSFGLMFHHQLILNHAVREAARRGAVGATDAEIGAVLRAQCVGLDKSRLTWTITPPDTSADRAPDGTLTIQAEYQDRVLIPLVGILVGSKTLRARSQILIEIYPRMP